MAGRLREVSRLDFSGGVNAVSNPYAVTEKQCQRIDNMLLDEHASLRTRDGYSVLGTSPDSTNPIMYRSILNTTTGLAIPYIIQNNTLWRTDTNPFTLVGTYLNAANYRTPQSITVIDKEVIAVGYEPPLLWDGTTFGAITAQPGQLLPQGAKHLAFHLGSVWLWNTAAATSALDGQSSLRMSDPNNPNSWPSANQTFISKDDGQVGMGLSSFTIAETGISPTQTLIAFKNYSAYQVTGVFGGSLTIQRVKSDMGCTAPRTIQFVSGFGIIRMTHKGFALFNGVEDRLVSEEIRPYIFGRDGITPLNFTSIDLSWAVQSQNPPLYVAACPVVGTGLTRIFVYDLVRRAWTICTFPISFSTLDLFSALNQSPVVHAGTSVGGQIIKLFDGDITDNGNPVSWSFRSQPYFSGSPTRRSYFRRVLLDILFTPVQPVTISSTLLGITPERTETVTFSGAPSGSMWGSSIWGSFVWGAGTTVDGRQDISVMRTAPALTLDISGTGPVRVRALTVQMLEKPLTRAVN